MHTALTPLLHIIENIQYQLLDNLCIKMSVNTETKSHKAGLECKHCTGRRDCFRRFPTTTDGVEGALVEYEHHLGVAPHGRSDNKKRKPRCLPAKQADYLEWFHNLDIETNGLHRGLFPRRDECDSLHDEFGIYSAPDPAEWYDEITDIKEASALVFDRLQASAAEADACLEERILQVRRRQKKRKRAHSMLENIAPVR